MCNLRSSFALIGALFMTGCGSLAIPDLPFIDSHRGDVTREVSSHAPTEVHLIEPNASAKHTDAIEQTKQQSIQPDTPTMMLIRDNQLNAAETLLLAELKRRPDAVVARTNLGLLYANTGRPESAVTVLAGLVAEQPEACVAQVKLAQIYREAYQFQAAEDAYLGCLAHTPNDPAALLNLGILYELYRGDFDAARVQYERYQRSLPEPDRKVDGWIADLSRRDNQIAEAR